VVARERFELSSAGPEPKIKPISWEEVKNDFLVWCKARFGQRYVKDLKNTLEKWKPVIRSVEDIDRLFAGEFPGKRHLWFGVRNLLKYCMQHGWSVWEIGLLLAAMPPVPRSRPDNRVPREVEVIETFQRLGRAPLTVQAVFNLVLDSAVRPLHAVEIINGFDERRLERLEHGFYKYYVDIERREKHTFICFMGPETLNLIKRVSGAVNEHTYQHYTMRHKLLRPKLLQKFAYNMMRKSGVDRDIAEFISGRKPEGVGPKHYAELIMLAEEQYPKYAAYLRALRERINHHYVKSSRKSQN